MRLVRTPSQTVGPFYGIGLCRREESELVEGGTRLSGTLLDGDGVPVADGMIELWDPVGRRWGRSGTDADGSFSFLVAKPPRQGAAAPHLLVYVFARGLLKHQLTRIYFPDEVEANAEDPVLASLDEADRALLVAEQDDGALRFDIRMQGEQQTVFFTA
jgi:protocatechuate 3,4-dioxygenase, alpha subunit